MLKIRQSWLQCRKIVLNKSRAITITRLFFICCLYSRISKRATQRCGVFNFICMIGFCETHLLR